MFYFIFEQGRRAAINRGHGSTRARGGARRQPRPTVTLIHKLLRRLSARLL